jgi:hypothetical protein
MVVLLVVAAVLFVLSGVVGYYVNQSRSDVDPKTYDPDGWVEAMSGMLSGLQRKLEFDQTSLSSREFSVDPRRDRPLQVEVGAKAGEEARVATFVLLDGPTVDIVYKPTGTEDDEESRRISLKKDGPDKGRGKLTILEDGGTLTFTSKGNRPSKVRLE